ncbi:MAG: sugar phosphate isomerase/epimerase [Gammaproteobacteria bacterium]|nr:sugar phosphate isomerase/epimerase [Gammaproteobacteria bacterium]
MSEWAFQLFSARNTPLPQALQIVAEAGYTSVEAFGENFVEQDLFRESLENTGLTVVSAHFGRDRFRDSPDKLFETAAKFDIRHLVCPFVMPHERPKDAKGWQAFAKELAEYEQMCKQAGCSFSWHNHDFEFIALDDGTVPMEVLLEEAPELGWEIDVAWIVRAGGDPAAWINNYGQRISAVHVKDIAAEGECEDEDGWADVGHGTIDWPSIMPSLTNTPATIYAMEHDAPGDLKRFATRSIATANTW